MFSGNTLVFHHCLCRKISLQFAVPNAAIPGTKGDINLSYDCTCIPVTHSTACSIKLSSHHLKQTVLNIPRCCACTKRIAKGLATITVDNRSISSPKRLNEYYLYSYYQVFCTDIKFLHLKQIISTMLYHIAVVVRIHDILMEFTMTNLVNFSSHLISCFASRF